MYIHAIMMDSSISVSIQKAKLWRCWLMVLSEESSSAKNVTVFVLGCCSTILSNASSFTREGLLDLCLSSRQMSPSLKCLNQFWATCLFNFWAFHIINFFRCCPCTQSYFFYSWHKMAVITIFFFTHYHKCKLKNKLLMFWCFIWKQRINNLAMIGQQVVSK